LTQNLAAVETALQTQLGKVQNTLEVQLSALNQRLVQLDAPLNTAARNFTETFQNFNEHTNEWRTELQREFAKQTDTNQKQLQRLDSLSEQIPALLQQLTTSSNNFSESSGRFSEHGKQLSQDTSALTLNLGALSRGVDALSEQVSKQPRGNDRLVGLLMRLTSVLQELRERGEGLRGRR
jgi:chromosome segregation ATPase